MSSWGQERHFFLSTQKDDTSAVGQRTAPPDAAVAGPAAAGSENLRVAEVGVATFLIDAPLEKIKGRWTKFRGTISVDPVDLTKSKGEIDLDLTDLKTETFSDPSKDKAQTEHAHNWLEVGADAPNRETDRWARFTLGSVTSATPSSLAAAPDANGVRTVKLVVRGDLWLHGVTSPKTVTLTAAFSGPPAAPTSVHVTTDQPMPVSLKEHDVKPRDVAGKFLAGSLEKVGDKITDSALLTLDVTAVAGD